MNENLTKEELEEIIERNRNKADLMHRANLKKLIELNQRKRKLRNIFDFLKKKNEIE